LSADDVFPGDELPSALNEQKQDVQRDSLQLESTTGASQFIGIAVEFQAVSEFHNVHGHIATTN